MAVLQTHYTAAHGANQEMETNGTLFGEELVIAFIALFLFGVLYNIGIGKFPWLASRRPAEQVVIGVGVTVLVSGFVVGWLHTLVMLVLFIGSGLPMIVGSWVRAAQDDEDAKVIAREALRK
jgi:hypothetical protein